MTPSPITEIMAHLGVILMTPDVVQDAITLEHIRAAHDLAAEEWRREQDELYRIDYDLDMARQQAAK